MFLGTYRFAGGADELRAAYGRLLASIPHDGLHLHVAVTDVGGLWIYDTCPTREAFESFAASPGLQAALAGAGLPEPVVTPVGEVHAAFVTGRQLV